MPLNLSLDERIIVYTEIRGEDDCWPWFGNCTGEVGSPTPKLTFNGHALNVRRYILEKKLGLKLTKTQLACHTCNNGLCMNPKHLYAGTSLSNVLDMVSAGNHAHGERQGHARHTEREVRYVMELLASGLYSYKEIAEMTGFVKTDVYRIKKQLTWRHITAC